MNPLQDITNQITASSLEPDHELLNSMEFLSFSPLSFSPRRPPPRAVPQRNSSTGSSTDEDNSSLSTPSSPSSGRNVFNFYSERNIYGQRSLACNSSEISNQNCPRSFNFFGSCEIESDMLATLHKDQSEGSCMCVQEERKTENITKRRATKRLSLPSSLDYQGSTVFKRLQSSPKEQLVNLMCSVSKLSSQKNRVGMETTDPVLEPEIRLKILLKNIKKSLPGSSYGSNRDAVSFRRVEIHLLMFKQECLKQCRLFFDECIWKELFDYVMTSVVLIHELPVWENTSHNLHKEQLYRIMVLYCRKIITLANFDAAQTRYVRNRLAMCLKFHQKFEKIISLLDSEH